MDLALVHDALWRNALGFIPVALAAAMACKLLPLRSSTKHLLWTVALLSLILPPVLPSLTALIPSSSTPDQQRVHRSDAFGASQTRERSVPPWSRAAAPALASTPTMDAVLPRFALSTPRRSVATTVDALTQTQRHTLELAPVARPVEPASVRFDRAETGRAEPVVLSPAPVFTERRATEDRMNAPDRAGTTVMHTPGGRSVVKTVSIAVGTLWRSALDRADLVAWLDAARALRTRIVSLPPVPLAIWLGGAALVALSLLGRIASTRRLLARAEPAPPDMQKLIDDSAAAMSLRAAPRAYMLADRVSPMLFCGARPRLILPAELWMELDDTGRRAVVHHELAHLKRRDHWLRWAELAVACVYWWHPMVWWVRKRIREEADHCCDAWVTALMPADRRAYATALVRTSAYLTRATHAPGPAGLGVATANARRFARRLTMVMTHRSGPRLGIAGLALAATFAALTTVATPLWACPTEKRIKPAPAPTAEPAPAPGDSTFERFLEQREGATTRDRVIETDRDDSLDARMRDLEARLRAALRRVGPLLAAAPTAPTPPDCDTPQAQAAPPSLPTPIAPLAYVPLAPIAGLLAADTDGDLIDRVYTLPPDQLEALTALMVRDDVPVLVRPGDGEIGVRATAGQHAVFAAFVALINTTESTATYRLSEGALDALTALMALNSVPVLVRPGDGVITVVGTELDQQVFSAFGRLIDPVGFARVDADAPRAPSGRVTVAPPADSPMMRDVQARAKAAMSRSLALTAEADRLDAQRGELEAHIETLAAQSEELEDQADAIADEADELLDRAEELVSQAEDEGDAGSRYRLTAEAGALKAEAGALRLRAESIAVQAAATERQADVLEAQLDSMEDRADALRDEAEAIEEAVEEEVDRLEDALDEKAEQARAQMSRFTEQARAQSARTAEQIDGLIEQYAERLSQRVEGQSEVRLAQRLSQIEQQAAQRVIVRTAGN